MRNYYILLAILTYVQFCACEDTLRMIPENSVTFENAFENEREIEIGVLTVERYARKYLGMTDIQYPALYGAYSNYHTPLDAALLRENDAALYTIQWNHIYEVIAMANVPLPYIDKVEMPQERRNFYKGQIFFTKALAYFELGRRWGRCPIIRDEVKFQPVEFSSWVKVIDYAIELTRKAIKSLPEYPDLKDCNGNAITYKSVPCKGAAQALLAHLCAWKAGCKYMAAPEEATYDEQALWSAVDSACTALINSPVYELAKTPEEVCTSTLVGGDQESIYENVLRGFWEEMENEDPFSITNRIFCFGRFFQSWPVVTNTGEGDIQNMKYRILNTSVREMYPTRTVGDQTVTDLRRDAYFYDFERMEAEDTDITGGYAYPWKWRLARVGTSGWDIGEFSNFDQNRIWFRLADIILLRAECRARLGNQSGAIADLNRIRERANAELYNSSEYDGNLRYAIYKEREKELLMEGWRWYDIIRNGYYKTELYGGFRNVSAQDIIDGVFFNGVDDIEFENNPLARQNTYWLKRI
ncbi:RagB/SusD family nutrient uptake outer membrane protein [Butyricimonas synergistica]|uniref:RagB/SusD family nutrient uptake outer membrane protein n=1 Tax=Butyricimonas synergistica TaxID=544644 RepID=UPI00037041AE|nr:RagB/SusD family nutrient uptake outer membrane protein [Butyricimonas synergistica]